MLVNERFHLIRFFFFTRNFLIISVDTSYRIVNNLEKFDQRGDFDDLMILTRVHEHIIAPLLTDRSSDRRLQLKNHSLQCSGPRIWVLASNIPLTYPIILLVQEIDEHSMSDKCNI